MRTLFSAIVMLALCLVGTVSAGTGSLSVAKLSTRLVFDAAGSYNDQTEASTTSLLSVGAEVTAQFDSVWGAYIDVYSENDSATVATERNPIVSDAYVSAKTEYGSFKIGRFEASVGTWYPRTYFDVDYVTAPVYAPRLGVENTGLNYDNTCTVIGLGTNVAVNYSAYVSRTDDSERVYGGDVNASISALTLGVSLNNTNKVAGDVDTYVYYSSLALKSLDITAELFDQEVAGTDYQPYILGVSADVLPKVLAGVRYTDFLKDGQSDESIIAPYIAVSPVSNVKIKVEYDMHKFADNSQVNYDVVRAYIGCSFTN
jgi:hypothetical protein